MKALAPHHHSKRCQQKQPFELMAFTCARLELGRLGVLEAATMNDARHFEINLAPSHVSDPIVSPLSGLLRRGARIPSTIVHWGRIQCCTGSVFVLPCKATKHCSPGTSSGIATITSGGKIRMDSDYQ